MAVLLALLLPLAGAVLEFRSPPGAEADCALEGEELGLPPMVALTFDDGPRRSTTTALLDGLKSRGVHATFFLIGEQVPGQEELVQRMEREGHQVGMHSYTHVNLSGLNDRDFEAEVNGTRELLTEVLGHGGFCLRPPYGLTDEGVLRRAGCPLILWSLDPKDWDDKNTERIISEILSEAEDGDIILMHDIYETSVEAALAVIDGLQSRGFLFLTVDELCQARGVTLKPGEICRSLRN